MVTVSTSSSSLAAFPCQQSHRFVLASAWIPGTNAAGGDEQFFSRFLPQRVPRHHSFSRQDGDSSPQPAREHLSCSARPGLGGAAGPDPVAGKQTCLIAFFFFFFPLLSFYHWYVEIMQCLWWSHLNLRINCSCSRKQNEGQWQRRGGTLWDLSHCSINPLKTCPADSPSDSTARFVLVYIYHGCFNQCQWNFFFLSH